MHIKVSAKCLHYGWKQGAKLPSSVTTMMSNAHSDPQTHTVQWRSKWQHLSGPWHGAGWRIEALPSSVLPSLNTSRIFQTDSEMETRKIEPFPIVRKLFAGQLETSSWQFWDFFHKLSFFLPTPLHRKHLTKHKCFRNIWPLWHITGQIT